MNKLINSHREKIQLLQKKVDKYQVDPALCAALSSEQSTMLAELQNIYDNLSNQTFVNDSAIFNTVCKTIKDKIAQFNTIYANMEPEQLYITYLKKYKEAKTTSNEANRLDKLDMISSEDLLDVPYSDELVPKT